MKVLTGDQPNTATEQGWTRTASNGK